MDKKKIEMLMGEIIGRKAKITKSTQKNQKDINGTIINETMKTITMETKEGEKTLQKNMITIKIDGTEINGKELEFRPEERIKKYWRKFDAAMR